MSALGTLGARVARAIVKAAGFAAVPVNRASAWFPVIRESFTGAWQMNVEEKAESLLTYSAVYACVTLIAGDIGKLPLRLVERGANGIWKEVESAAFSPVLRKPNGYQSRIAFVEQWIVSKLLHGNAYVLKERDERNVVVALYVLDPTRVTPLVAPNGEVYYEVATDWLAGLTAPTVRIPASEIIHDRMIPLFHPLVGVSPLTACGLAAVGGLAITRNAAQFFKNGATPSGLLLAPEAISNETAERMKTLWEEKFAGGAGNYGRIAVLGDKLTYQPLTMNAVDAQLIEQLKWSAETVCSTFHVPPYMIGVGQIPTYNNIEALNQQYYSQALQVLIESLELALDEGLALDKVAGKIYGAELDIRALLRMDTATRVKTFAEAIKGGLLKPNEGRAEFDLAPVEGGDQVYLQQQNYSLAALAKRDAKEDPFATSAPKPKPAPGGDDEESDDDEDQDAAGEEKSLAELLAAELGLDPIKTGVAA